MKITTETIYDISEDSISFISICHHGRMISLREVSHRPAGGGGFTLHLSLDQVALLAKQLTLLMELQGHGTEREEINDAVREVMASHMRETPS